MTGAPVTPTAAEPVGRDRELDVITELIDRSRSGFAALVIEGDAGMGKSTLWRFATAAARSTGARVLSARPAETEVPIEYSALRDLFASVGDDVLAVLPGPQHRALARVLVRVDDDGALPSQAQVVAAGTTSLLVRLASERPVVLAIDDLQWLDRASGRALSFALRRLVGCTLGVVVTRRTSSDGSPLGLADAGPDGMLVVHRLPPLDLDDLHRLLKERLGSVPPRPALVRIAQTSGGNPMYALELARAGADRTDAAGPMPLPPSLREITASRLRDLSTAELDVLLVVAAGGAVPESILRRQPDSSAVIERAESCGLVELERGMVRMAHPLLASGVYDVVTTSARRRAHATLAAAASDPVDAARHLALATMDPDEVVAQRLDDAADVARRRGTPEVAAELVALALELGDLDGAIRHRRLLDLARHRFHAGDALAAIAAADRVVGEAGGRLAVEAHLLLAEVHFDAGSAAVAAAHCAEGLAQVDEDAIGLRARLHATAALVDYGDFERSVLHAEQARALIERLGRPDPYAEGLALFALVANELLLGRGFRRAEALRAVELERTARAARVADRPSAAIGVWLNWVDELDAAREALEQTLVQAHEEGDESSIPYALSHLSNLELRAGNWQRARSLATEVLQRAEVSGQAFQQAQGAFLVSTVDAHLGHLDDAERLAHAALIAAEEWGDRWLQRGVRGVLGFCALSRGDLLGARKDFGVADEITRTLNIRDPGSRRTTFQLADVLIALGELDAAAEVLTDLEPFVLRLDVPSTRAALARLRALWWAASGDLESATHELEESFGQIARVRLPFDEAQLWLTRGQLERRRRRRAASNRAFQEAARRFDDLGAQVWAQRARAEAGRLGLRRGPSGELTVGERRVAELAATGLTNREVAGALFISAKTVEANLARVYRKLGIRSRAELGRVMTDTPTTTIGDE